MTSRRLAILAFVTAIAGPLAASRRAAAQELRLGDVHFPNSVAPDAQPALEVRR